MSEPPPTPPAAEAPSAGEPPPVAARPPGSGAAGRPPGALTPAQQPSEGALPPLWLRPQLDYPSVKAFGYRFARATWIERGFWVVALAAALTVLSLAAFKLTPDASGIGTHQQLGLPPCGFIAMSGGYPCPSCGYTTTFTLAAHGRPLDAFANQPFGFVVFCLTVIAVPATAVSVFRRVSLFAATERWPWFRIFAALLLGWLGAWLYKASFVAG